MPFYSPLRYPGGKRKLASFVQSYIEVNGLDQAAYIEPYAGGAGVALHLLLETNLPQIIINDIDPSIYSFWAVVKDNPEELCRRISKVRIDMAEWQKQKSVQAAKDPCRIDLAFSTLFMNRTNRSGVLLGGVIGGKEQRGPWKMSARFNKETLIARIEAISARGDRLKVMGIDAAVLVEDLVAGGKPTFLFLDPPYYHKAERLYRNDYVPSDHVAIATILRKVHLPWLLAYDDCPEIRDLYGALEPISLTLSYTAGKKCQGKELLYVSPGTVVPSFKGGASGVRFNI